MSISSKKISSSSKRNSVCNSLQANEGVKPYFYFSKIKDEDKNDRSASNHKIYSLMCDLSEQTSNYD